jgi:two-component sensor histidine kinase
MAIAAVHHRLYDGGSVRTGDAAQYLVGLLADMKQLVPDLAADRLLGFDISPFTLAADDIAPLGLITIELVTNALKYGRGNVEVSVQRRATGLEIAVSDQGDGFPPDFDPIATHGLGMKLVTALARTADGSAVQVDRTVPFGRIRVRTAFGGSG